MGLTDRKVKARTEVVRVCLNGEVTGQLRKLDQELALAEREDELSNQPDRAPGIAREIEALQREAEKDVVEIRMRGVGDKAWSDLLDKHPPTKEQKAEASRLNQGRPMFDPDTFPYAAVAASIVDVDGEPDSSTAEELREFFDEIPGEWLKVWNTCYAVNRGENSVPTSRRASRHLIGSEPSSTPAAPTESADPTS